MNLRKMVEGAQEAVRLDDKDAAMRLAKMAHDYLDRVDPDGNLDSYAVCCFSFDGTIIDCGSGGKPLFPGTLEERRKSCKSCRDWCRKELSKLENQSGST